MFALELWDRWPRPLALAFSVGMALVLRLAWDLVRQWRQPRTEPYLTRRFMPWWMPRLPVLPDCEPPSMCEFVKSYRVYSGTNAPQDDHLAQALPAISQREFVRAMQPYRVYWTADEHDGMAWVMECRWPDEMIRLGQYDRSDLRSRIIPNVVALAALGASP